MSSTPEETSGLQSSDFQLESDLDATPPAARLYLQTFDPLSANPEA